MKRRVLAEIAFVVCFAFSLILVLLPLPYMMVDFLTYMVYEEQGRQVIYSQIEIVEEPILFLGKGFGLGRIVGGGGSSQLIPIYNLPSESIISLQEDGSVTLSYMGKKIELGVGEDWTETKIRWFDTQWEPIPNLLLGVLIYDKITIRSMGYINEIRAFSGESRYKFTDRPVFIEIWHGISGTRYYLSPNLIVSTILLAWNTWKLRKGE